MTVLTFLCPMYPTMPHMSSRNIGHGGDPPQQRAPVPPRDGLSAAIVSGAVLAGGRAEPLGPALLVFLAGARQGEGVRRDVLGDGGAGADERAAAHTDRSDQLRVAPDEDLVLDDGPML